MGEPWIVHMDADAFFASVEQLRNPRLKERPVAVGNGCIASCSYEARKFGLKAGMSLGEARRRCPSLIVLDGEYAVYKSFAERLWELAGEVSPCLETFLDDAYLDLTGTHWVYGEDPVVPVSALKRRILEETGLRVTCGIGPSRMIARMASADVKPDGLCRVLPQEVDLFLRDKPTRSLPGVGPKIEEMLRTFNVRTIGEMREIPLEGWRRLFGQVGNALYERCRGRDSRVIAEKEIPRSVSRETTFHRETSDPVEVEAMIHYLAERAFKTLRDLGLQSKTVRLKIRYCDGKGEEGGETLPKASSLEREIYSVLLHLLGRLWGRRVALRQVGVVLLNMVPGENLQLDLFEEENLREARVLAEAVDEVRDRFGFSSVVVGKSIDLLPKLKRTHHGYVLRTPSLTK